MFNLNVSQNIGKITRENQSLLSSALLDEFGNEDVTLRVNMAPFGQNCILQDQPKNYVLLLASENIVCYTEREDNVRAVIRHEHGHIPFLEKENIFSPHLLSVFKKMFGMGSFTEEEVTNTVKVALQNRMIDGGIFSSDDRSIKSGLLETYLEEQVENIKTLPTTQSPTFAPTVLDILQKTGTLRFAKNEHFFEGIEKEKANFVMRLFYDNLRNKTLRFPDLQEAIDECLRPLVEVDDYHDSWKSLNKSFNNFMGLL